MRLLIKFVGLLLALVLVIAGVGLLYFVSRYPQVPEPRAVTLPSSPDALARGEYLTRHVVGCVACHSERDFSRSAGPLKPGSFGKGGEPFSDEGPASASSTRPTSPRPPSGRGPTGSSCARWWTASRGTATPCSRSCRISTSASSPRTTCWRRSHTSGRWRRSRISRRRRASRSR
ncbi:MAG: hypothetical protein R2712_26720 [Vicinamibacterales bacterium]